MGIILDGLKLMVTGMGMVFFFLVVMIFWIQLSSKISGKYAHLLPEDKKPTPRRPTPPKAPATVPAAPQLSAVTAAVVSAAVHLYRHDHEAK